jgi:hypothetical protein
MWRKGTVLCLKKQVYKMINVNKYKFNISFLSLIKTWNCVV